LTTAIIGVGNIGTAVARRLVAGDQTVVVAAKDASHADTLAPSSSNRERARPPSRTAIDPKEVQA
jgi:8-hydroxy-5-deazaflavin:NADPH oxidoreductase